MYFPFHPGKNEGTLPSPTTLYQAGWFLYYRLEGHELLFFFCTKQYICTFNNKCSCGNKWCVTMTIQYNAYIIVYFITVWHGYKTIWSNKINVKLSFNVYSCVLLKKHRYINMLILSFFASCKLISNYIRSL